MLRGIDVASYQENIEVDKMPIDFAIAKATQGNYYVNPYCDGVIQRCIKNNKCWGFYHFADERQSATENAVYFINNTSNYFRQGIPILDWEELYDKKVKVSDPSVEWVNAFVKTVHDQTGIWPWIYANPWRFNQGGVEPNCARWVAQYPNVIRPTLDYDPGEPPATDGLVACWQYASDGNVPGYDGNLDVNHFFGDRAAWKKYAGDVYAGEQLSTLENSEYKVTIERK